MGIHDKVMRDGKYFSQFYDTVGDRSGSINMNVDGSVTPVHFKITVPDGYVYYFHRMIGLLKDTGSFDSGGFGNGPALTNGLHMGIISPEDVHMPITTQLPFRHNSDFAAYCYDVSVHTWGAGDEFLTWRYTLTKDGAATVMQPGWTFAWRVDDDLSVLTDFTIRCGIVRVPTAYSAP